MTAVPEQQQFHVNGIDLTCFTWPGRAEQPLILLVHATGFHARCWDQVVRHLPERRVIAVDMRGHGRSSKAEPITWDAFGRDLAELVAALGIEGAIGVGHSMGGHSLVQAAAAHPDAFSRLLLVDPVIMAPEIYAAGATWVEGEEHPTARRRNHWQSVEEMVERFRDRMPFAAWDPRVLEDYCRYGLLPDPDGRPSLVLACPPAVEAAIYMGSASRDIHGQVARVQVPVTVLRARPRPAERDPMDFSSSPTWPELADHFPAGRDVHLPEYSHFIPMEAPELVASYILGGDDAPVG